MQSTTCSRDLVGDPAHNSKIWQAFNLAWETSRNIPADIWTPFLAQIQSAKESTQEGMSSVSVHASQ